MNKYVLPGLVGVIVLLSALVIGMLIFMQNRPTELRAIQQIYPVQALEPDSELWGRNYPNQYSTLLQTRENIGPTTFGGSGWEHLETNPRLRILYAGMGFSVHYAEDRGHEYALEDVLHTRRIPDQNAASATCYSCKSADMPRVWEQYSLEEIGQMAFAALESEVTHTVGCANCHEAETMRLTVSNPALDAGLKAQGQDWRAFTRQEMRSVVCANCHVEYYFAPGTRALTLPWQQGTDAESMYAYFDDIGFQDWVYPETATPMLKVQHPEYEFFIAGSTHYSAGVACADCHMPYIRDGAAKFSDHNIRSPLRQPERACGQCHSDVQYVTGRVSIIQQQFHVTKLVVEDAIIDAINALSVAVANPNSDMALLDEARELHRQSAFYWDYAAMAENSTGFHNPQYGMKLLSTALDLARQSQMKSAQAVDDPSLLQIGTYYLNR